MDLTEKNKLKKKYLKLFKEIYALIAEDNAKAQELISRLSDLAVVLDECKEHLNEEGAVTTMSQGNYTIDRENPWSKVQDAKQKTYLSVMTKLDDMMPTAKEANVQKAGEALSAFISKGKKVELR